MRHRQSKWHLFVATLVVAFAGPTAAQAQSRPCESAEYQQFDFWLGNWDVVERGGTAKVADVRVERALDGCVVQESYQDATGLRGTSLSSYDAHTATWQQTWVTTRGELLVIHGRREGPAMVFSGWLHEPTREWRVRATWAPDGYGVRETTERSADGGTTWRPWFDLMFRRASSPARPEGR